MHSRPPDIDRLIVSFSDIEMGAGGLLDDFPHSDWFDELLATYDRLDLPVDLVLNGDTFDFLKTSVDGAWPRHVTAEVALAKLERVAAAHPRFFTGLRRFLAVPNRTVAFTIGNHDAELLFPEVQQAVTALVDAPLQFPGFAVDIGDAHFEHGAQADAMFQMDPADLFVEHEGHRLLRLPWGTVGLLDVAMPMHPLVYDLDRVKPHGRVLELLPDLRHLLVRAYWRYWTGEYARSVYARVDPLRTVSWTMLKEVSYRLITADSNLGSPDHFLKMLEGDAGYRVVVVGHVHEPALVVRADRRMITTGCLRNEYVIDHHGTVLGALPKSWAHLWQRDGRTLFSSLEEAYGPPAPVGHAPVHARDVLPRLAHHILTPDEAASIAAEEQAQRDRER
jgi:hypothetical protein